MSSWRSFGSSFQSRPFLTSVGRGGAGIPLSVSMFVVGFHVLISSDDTRWCGSAAFHLFLLELLDRTHGRFVVLLEARQFFG